MDTRRILRSDTAREETRKRVFKDYPKRKRSTYFFPSIAEQYAPVTEHRDAETVSEENEARLTRIFGQTPRRRRVVYPKLPMWLVQEVIRMDASEPKLVTVKILDSSDIDPKLNRLLIPHRCLIERDFLSLEEIRLVDDDDITNVNKLGVGAFLFDQKTTQWQVGFQQWFVKTTSEDGFWSFVLGGQWHHVVKANELQEGAKVFVWSFRNSNGILCFGLVH